jgi:serine/threonine protein kinase
MIKLLGSGSFGHCFSAEKSDDTTNVAWKRNIKVSRVLGREYEVLLALKDQSNCLQLTDYFFS